MRLEPNVGGRDRLVRALLAALLAAVAVTQLRTGNRLRGGFAALGALGLGFNVTTCFCGVNRAIGLDTTE